MFTYKLNDGMVPIKSWIPEEKYFNDAEMVKQCENLSKLPFAFRHIVICPDGHLGYGMPIGGVLATRGVIIPNAVGVDIGCGMCAVKTPLTEITSESLKRILQQIRETIPVGFKHHKHPQNRKLMPEYGNKLMLDDCPIIEEEYMSALKQIGTLGSGNHFVEIQKGDDGFIWVMIHSGSRNLGYRVAHHYNKIAIELNRKWYSSVPEKHELAFLPFQKSCEESTKYFREMTYCVKFALANRKLMMTRVLEAFEKEIPNMTFPIDNMINIAHNYAALENHFGKNVMVHRKGATRAYEGEIGIIPGSQGSKSYIVKGKGNRESFMSCSHGAGRSMSITAAIKTLSFEEEVAKLNKLGTLHTIRNKDDLGEADGAYKDISIVMENQEDLIDIIVELTPIATVKGKAPRRKKKNKGVKNA